MFLISKTIPELTTALKQGYPIKAKAGMWKIQHPIMHWLCGLFNREEYSLLYLAQYLIHLLEKQEEEPSCLLSRQKKEGVAREKRLLELGNVLLRQIACHPKAIHVHRRLQRYLIGLEYRIEESLPLKKNPFGIYNQLKKAAKQWKERQIVFSIKDLEISELRKLKDVALYDKFANLLIDDFSLQDQFFNWTLKERNQIAVFIEFPKLQQTLTNSKLSCRIGKIVEGKLLKITKIASNEGLFKTVTLPFEGKDLPILNPHQIITFSESYSLKLQEIYEIFEKKQYDAGNLEFLAEGVVNWNPIYLGRWNPFEKKLQLVNLLDQKWWELLPCVEIIEKKEAKRRYGRLFDSKSWIVAAAATRGTPTLNFEETHAYLEIAIPLNRQLYRIYDFGKVATFFPSNAFEMLKIFCRNLYAALSYPDDNIFYSHRQKAYHAYALQPHQGKMLMEKIKREIFLSRQNNFIYQIESENCAKWVYETLVGILGKKQIPNLFKMKLLHTEPVGVVAKIFAIIKQFPESMQTFILTTLHLPLGAWIGTWVIENRQKIKKAVMHHPFWKTGEVYLPARLHDLKAKGFLMDFILLSWLKWIVEYRALFLRNYIRIHKVLPKLILINLTDKSFTLVR